MKREQILAILYEMAIVIGGEIRLQPLLTKTLQRFLFHTSFPCGMVFLDTQGPRSPEYHREFAEVRLAMSVGDFELARLNDTTVRIPTALLQGGPELSENGVLLSALPCRKGYYRVFLRLPIDDSGVMILLSPHLPASELPLTRIFQPVLSNFAKSILLCQSNEAYTQGIITDRRMAETALRDLSYRNRLILDSVGEGICGLDRDGNATFVNPAAAKMLGYGAGELIGRPLHEILHHQRPNGTPVPHEQCPITLTIREGGRHRVSEDLFRRKDGTNFPVEYVCTPMRENESMVGAVIVFQDISERKKAEEEIRQLASIVESSDDAIIGKTLEGTIVSWNKGAENIYGYSAEEMKGKSVSLLVPRDIPDDLGQILERIQRDEHMEHYETRRVRKDGNTIDVSLTVSPVKDAAGRITGISAIARDITEQKKAGEQLKRANAYNRSLIESSLDPLVTIGADGKITDVNSATETVTGLSRSELIGTDFSDYFTEPGLARAGYQQVFREGSVRDYALEIRHCDGRITPVLYNATRYRDDAGKVLGVFAAARDITERKRMEDSLLEQKWFAESLVENSAAATFVIDRHHRVVIWNKACEELTGVASSDMIGTGNQWSPFYDQSRPTLADLVLDGANEHMNSLYAKWGASPLIEKGLQAEGWFPRLNGKSRYIVFDAAPIFTSKGELIVAIETLHDITERKQAENDLTKLNRTLLTLSASNMTLIHAADEASLLRDICRAAVEAGNYSLVWVGYAEQDGQKVIRPVAFAGSEDGYLKTLPLAGEGPCTCPPLEAIQTGEPVVEQDIGASPDQAAWRTEALKRGYASCIALPLRLNNGVIGALCIYAREPEAFTADERKLLTELAGDLSFGIKTLRTRIERDRAVEERRDYLEKLRKVMEDTVQAIAAILEMRDPYLSGHQRRVAQLAVAISKNLGLSPQCIEGIHFGSLIHDIGKIYVPAEFLSRPGRLLDLEFSLIKTHPQVGFDIVKDIEFPWPVAQMIRQHHEHMNGTGYPQGLKGDEIIIEARILVVADVVEAMASHRPYRPARGIDTALEEIAANRGILYDIDVADACVRLFREKGFIFT